jgi:hypothetical protein
LRLADHAARGRELQVQRERFLLDRVVQIAREALALGERRELRARAHEPAKIERHPIEQRR